MFNNDKPKTKIASLRMAISKYNRLEIAPVSLSSPPWETEDGQEDSRDAAIVRGNKPTTRGEE